MENKKPVVAANWKMFKTPQESYSYVELLKKKILDIEGVNIILCAPFTSLFYISPLFDKENLELGAQNMALKKEGAFTGEISPTMLKASGAKWVILGHSERRSLFGETDEEIAGKVSLAIAERINPILCIGETLEERKSGKTFSVLQKQLGTVLELLEDSDVAHLVTAYEPIWAIGTGLNATPDQIWKAHSTIREFFEETFPSIGRRVRILYGGSVGLQNCMELGDVEGVDGFLVGGTSLDVNEFVTIIKSVE